MQQQQQQQQYTGGAVVGAGADSPDRPQYASAFAAASVVMAIFVTIAISTPSWYIIEDSGFKLEYGPYKFKNSNDRSSASVTCSVDVFSCTVDCGFGSVDLDSCPSFAGSNSFAFLCGFASWAAAVLYVAFLILQSANRPVWLEKASRTALYVSAGFAAASMLLWIAWVEDQLGDSRGDVDTSFYYWGFFLLGITAIFQVVAGSRHSSAQARYGGAGTSNNIAMQPQPRF